MVLGGARSGKSAHAESLLTGQAVVHYIDTVQRSAEDAEWAEHIARRREHRPEHWQVHRGVDVADVLGAAAGAVLLDSVTGWLAALLEDVGLWRGDPGAKTAIAGAVDRLVGAWAATTRLVVAVSDELGSGLPPRTPERRLFRDVLGLLNQRLAASADEVWQVTAGIPRRLR